VKRKRQGQTRKASLSSKRLTTAERQIAALLYPERPQRPRTRGECPDVRPCPWVGCRYNTYLEVSTHGSLTLFDPGRQPWDVSPATSCALDVAERGGVTPEDVGAIFGMSRERIRQIEQGALAQLEGEDLDGMLEAVAELAAGRDAGDEQRLG
jgi:hypothetical protein